MLFQAGSDKKAIGERIKEYRVARGLTQPDLANKANITRIALGNYERGYERRKYHEKEKYFMFL